MFGLLNNLAKAAVATVVTPVALAADIVRLPVTAFVDTNPFESTEKSLEGIKKNLSKAIDPNG